MSRCYHKKNSSGKERDAETGLDYFGARYYSGALGRFTSPDAPFADQHPANPQSWNLYSYGRNNPLANVDVNGNQSVPAKVQQMLEKYAPSALATFSKVSRMVTITQKILGGMHDIGMLPAMSIPGPNSPPAEIEQANANDGK
jgi:RHS repeat-associated protein